MNRRGILFRAIVLLAAVSGTQGAAAERAVDEFSVAAGHYQAQRWKFAAEDFASFRKLFPDHALAAEAEFYEAEARAQLGQFAEAAAALDTLITSGRAGKRLQRAMFRRGETAYLARDYDSAKRHLQTYWNEFPDDELLKYVLAYLGDIHSEDGEHGRAEEAYRTCLARDGQGPLAASCRRGLARALIAQNKTAAAEEVLTNLAESDDGSIAEPSLLELARLAYQRRDFAAARERCETLVARGAENEHAGRLILAKALHQLGERAAAEEAFREVFESGAAEALREAALYGLIRLAVEGADPAELERLAGKFVTSFASSELVGVVHAGLGESRLARREFASAREAFEEALASGSADRIEGPCHAGLAICSAAEGDLDQARSHLAALGSRPGQQEVIANTTYRVAELVYSGGLRDDAVDLFQEVVNLRPSPELAAKALAGLAWSRLRQEDLLGSADAFEQLIEKYPSDPRAGEAGLLRAQILERRGECDAALATYRRVINDLADREVLPRALFFAARLHDRLRQLSEARAGYERLIGEFPEHERSAEARYHLGWVLRDSGDTSGAVKQWQSVHETDVETSYWGEATYLLAEEAVDGGDWERAGTVVHALIAAIDERPGDDESGMQRAGEGLHARSRLLAAHIAMERDDWEAARGQLARIVADCPDDPLHPCAQFWLAEAEYRLGHFDAAHDQLRRLESVVAGRDDEWVPFVPLRLAQILAHRKEWPEAMAAAQRVIDGHPSFGLRYEADYVVGRCLATRGEFGSAREAYRRVIESETGGQTETAAMAQWMIGESYMHQQDYDAALRAYLRGEILFSYPAWQAASLLQAGKCYELMSQWDQAESTYRRLVERFPETNVVEEARGRLTTVTRQAARRGG